MKTTRMRNTEMLIGVRIWSWQIDFSWILFICSLPGNTILKNNSGYIKLVLSVTLKDMSTFDECMITRETSY